MSLLDDLSEGKDFEDVDPVGTNYVEARQQAYCILKNWNVNMVPVLIKIITEIQLKDKQIEMLEYQTKWRKRRP